MLSQPKNHRQSKRPMSVNLGDSPTFFSTISSSSIRTSLLRDRIAPPDSLFPTEPLFGRPCCLLLLVKTLGQALIGAPKRPKLSQRKHTASQLGRSFGEARLHLAGALLIRIQLMRPAVAATANHSESSVSVFSTSTKKSLPNGLLAVKVTKAVTLNAHWARACPIRLHRGIGCNKRH